MSPLITIIIPVYNEASTIRELLNRVQNAPYEKQIIIVNDASTDDTPAVLDNCIECNVLVVNHRVNLGKGRAIRTALESTTDFPGVTGLITIGPGPEGHVPKKPVTIRGMELRLLRTSRE